MPYHVTEQGEQRRQAMRKRLLEAARDLFIRQGYEATTMQQVVQQAGTSVGNCYFYFANKGALLQGVVEDFAQGIAREIDLAAEKVPPGPEQLAVALTRGVEVALAQQDLVRVLLTEGGDPKLVGLVLEHFAARLPQYLERGGVAYSPLEIRMIGLAYQGVVFQVLGGVFLGDLQVDARTLGRFLSRWNLQALGIPPEAVEAGIKAIDMMPTSPSDS